MANTDINEALRAVVPTSRVTELAINAAKRDEHKLLSESKRCAGCFHLQILHNGHCCSFCTVPNCKCDLDGHDEALEDACGDA